jgi:hypothetical protein
MDRYDISSPQTKRRWQRICKLQQPSKIDYASSINVGIFLIDYRTNMVCTYRNSVYRAPLVRILFVEGKPPQEPKVQLYTTPEI